MTSQSVSCDFSKKSLCISKYLLWVLFGEPCCCGCYLEKLGPKQQGFNYSNLSLGSLSIVISKFQGEVVQYIWLLQMYPPKGCFQTIFFRDEAQNNHFINKFTPPRSNHPLLACQSCGNDQRQLQKFVDENKTTMKDNPVNSCSWAVSKLIQSSCLSEYSITIF